MQRYAHSNRRLLIKLLITVMVMFLFGYALVPIYNVVCSAWGVNGKTGGAVEYEASDAHIDTTRTVTVEFLATNNDKMVWKFQPNTKKIQMHPGEMKYVSYYAENPTDKYMVSQAIPSVTPGIAAKYLLKTECFCFTQQPLEAHGVADLPLLFHVDRDLPKNIETITLSYTLFDVTEFMPKATNKILGRIN